MADTISAEEYKELKNNLNKKDREDIEMFEKDCENLKIGYFEFYRRVEAYKVGQSFTARRIRELMKTPMYKMRLYLLYRAAELRGIKFAE